MSDSQKANLELVFLKYEDLLKDLHFYEVEQMNKKKNPKAVENLLGKCTQFLEFVFSAQEQLFLSVDFFLFLHKARTAFVVADKEYVWRLYQFAQLAMTNIKTSRELDSVLQKQGFVLFFTSEQKLILQDEILDYYINVVKSLVLKLDSESDFEAVRSLLI